MKKQRTLNLIKNKDTTIPSPVIFVGDIYASLSKLGDNSIDCIITSPPYFDQRDYGFDNQIGNESSIDDYLSKLSYIFMKLYRKLKQNGIFFLNIGDKYLSKYGNSTLGMIPYKLAFLMIKTGWILEETLIWYKPNHMPSSVKNRFTNTYEPVFVFSKNSENFFKNYKNSINYSNILKIPLQQTEFAHIATFPEKLVEKIILILDLNKNAKILDPFCGSGTLIKAVQNLNLLHKKKYKTYGIEAQNEYISIILERCSLSSNDLVQVDQIPFKYPLININDLIDNVDLTLNNNFNLNKIDYQSNELIINLTSNHMESLNFLETLKNQSFLDNLDDDGLIIFGLPILDLIVLLKLSFNKDLILRNVIICSQKKLQKYFVILMLVKDTKLVKYKFNLDEIRTNALYESNLNWDTKYFIGVKVIQSTTIFQDSREGVIVDIVHKNPNNFPKSVVVKWENSSLSIEKVVNFSDKERELIFLCNRCNEKLVIYYRNRKKTNCRSCDAEIWKDTNSIPKINFNKNFLIESKVKINSSKYENIKLKVTNNNYNGKFKNINRKNKGQSPGARLLTDEQYFFVTRYFKIKHGIFANYLNIKRKELGLTISSITKMFPDSYKHTSGHWFRTDMGGSLPKNEDLMKLEKILNLDADYIKMVSYTGIKFQTVLNNYKGKNPGDFLITSKNEIIEMFKKLVC